MGDFKKLAVWTKAHDLTLKLYRRTTMFPSVERYELASQIRRAAASIGANIAEGCGRGGDGQLSYFLTVAKGSASELEYHLMLVHDLGYINDREYVEYEENLREIGRMLASFSTRVASSRRTGIGSA